MPVDLRKPLHWTRADRAERALLADLQGNILKSHGRDHADHVILRFDPRAPAEARAFLRSLRGRVKTARRQLSEAAAYRRGVSGEVFVGLALSSAGYQVLGIPRARWPRDRAFRQGLKRRARRLDDSPSARWDASYRDAIHALLVVADDARPRVTAERRRLLAARPTAVRVLAIERGHVLRNAHRQPIEPFGYVDGRSMPRPLQEDVERERVEGDGVSVFHPGCPLGQVLVRDPGGAGRHSFGSYLVFRKLAQDVPGFKRAESALARALGLRGEAAERAGALVVGRFEDGTSVALQETDGVHDPIPNNFTYADDPEGGKCPLHAHVRQVNPRSGRTGVDLHQIVRRGIPYSQRRRRRNGQVREVGLLFMCYQNDLARQFEFLQRRANGRAAPVRGAGPDGLIGQGRRRPRPWPTAWGSAAGGRDWRRARFGRFVQLRGGEYFFTPSLSFLARL